MIPACAEWSQLEKLNKEREVIGLYLSAHPLDDYKVIIIRNMCKTQVGDLDHLDELKGKEIAVAGMVVAVQNLTTRPESRGESSSWRITTARTSSRFSARITRISANTFSDYFLFIRGRVQPRPYNDQGAGIPHHVDDAAVGVAGSCQRCTCSWPSRRSRAT